MDAFLRLLAIVMVPTGLIVGWGLSSYFISSYDEFVHSRYDIWMKKLSFTLGCGFGPAFLIWHIAGLGIFDKDVHAPNKPTSAFVAGNSEKTFPTDSAVKSPMPIGESPTELNENSEKEVKATSAELDVGKIIAEKRAVLLREHPACAEMFKQEEMNPGDNELQCANFEFGSADKELNATYKSVRESLFSERKAILKSEQIVWIKEKEGFCEGAANRSMSLSPHFREAATNFCLADVTQKRTEYLKAFR